MLKRELQQYKNIWIYGSGKNGRKLLQSFDVLGIKWKGIITSQKESSIVPGTDVISIDEISDTEDETAFIVPMDSKYHDGVKNGLRSRRYNNIYVWSKEFLTKLWLSADYEFTDRRKGFSKCCFLLAGYKDFLWDDVLERIKRFLPVDIEVCILSSGCKNELLQSVAENEGWSYLNTSRNSVTMIQNIAFALYDKAQWIYKIDEDMFVTEHAFEKLYDSYCNAAEGHYNVGFVAPLIPVNGYGYLYVLDEAGLMDEYELEFGKAYYGGNPGSEIEKNPETAVFMWDRCPRLDDLNSIFEKKGNTQICGVRFSVGMILLKKDFWELMGGFSVTGAPDMGLDEEEICATCINRSRAMIISHNTVIGHFSFGKQTVRMKEYRERHPERFSIMQDA